MSLPFLVKKPSLYQKQIDKLSGPKVNLSPNGNASIETYTVINDREGPSYSILFGRMENGSRFIANTPKSKELIRTFAECSPPSFEAFNWFKMR